VNKQFKKMNITNSSNSCFEPFRVELDIANNIPVFLFIVVCLVLGLILAYILKCFKLSTSEDVKNFITLLTDDIFYLYLGVLIPSVR